MITYIGTTFPESYQWHVDEVELINQIQHQIDAKYPTSQNLFINTTWFGPQFDNGQWHEYQTLIDQGRKFDNLFMLAAADPVFLNHDQIADIVKQTGATGVYLMGHFDGAYQFNFHSIVLPKYFKTYTREDLALKDIEWVFINYNRKPRQHRTDLVEKILKENLHQFGQVSLGKKDLVFTTTEQNLHLTVDPPDYDSKANWGMDNRFGISHDIHSLGDLAIWNNYFLNVVSETEFFPWDNLCVTEKTWKPIIGLRPFIVNGQTTIYNYLKNNGFKTFNHYWSHIDVESVNELELHDNIIQVIKYLVSLGTEKLQAMYQDMLPDLLHNQARFLEFAQEQKYKTGHLFE